MLKQLANMLERTSMMDIAETPIMRFSQELIDTLVAQEGFDPSFARMIAFRMKIKITSFDRENEDWQRIVTAYAILISKLYTEVEDLATMLHVATTLEIEYTGE